MRETLAHFFQRFQSLLRPRLIAAHVTDLFVLRNRRQVICIGRILVAGMQRDEPVGGIDRVIIFIALVVGEGLHQQGLGSPLGIGMLALNLGKAFGCGLVGAGF